MHLFVKNHFMVLKLSEQTVCVRHVYVGSLFLFTYQVAEKILNKKELEFYKWDGNLRQLLQNVRDRLNLVAEVGVFF